MRTALAGVAAALATAVPAAAPPVPRLDHVVVIVFENKERTEIVGNTAAPNFAGLAREMEVSGINQLWVADLTYTVRAQAHSSPRRICVLGGSHRPLLAQSHRVVARSDIGR